MENIHSISTAKKIQSSKAVKQPPAKPGAVIEQGDCNHPFRNLFYLLEEYKIRTISTDNAPAPTQAIKHIYTHSTNAVEHLFSSVESLGNVLAIAIQNTTSGIDNEHISNMGYLIQTLGEIGSCVANIKERSQEQLHERGVTDY